jgi:hypothetical protein
LTRRDAIQGSLALGAPGLPRGNAGQLGTGRASARIGLLPDLWEEFRGHLRFELVVNPATAGSLGIALPQSLPLSADRVIE